MADKKKNARQTGQSRQTGRASQASQMVEPEAKGVEQEKEQSKPSKAAARERERERERVREREREERKEKAPRREAKSSAPTLQSNLRKNRIIRYILESYYELRHKVTWPTFEEARNMTIAVIALSVVIGIILGIADFGLLHLYQLIAK
jgi:preprotein translocase subunit SecE